SHRLGFMAERLIGEVSEVKSVGRRTGRAELDEHAEGVHFSEIDVDLVRSTRSKPEIYADIRERLSALPASIAIGQPISHRLDHLQSGIRAQIVDGNRRFDVMIRLSDQDRSTTGLRDLRIATPTGYVPLGMFSEIAETDGPNQIQREGAQRRIVVYGNGDGRRGMVAIAEDI